MKDLFSYIQQTLPECIPFLAQMVEMESPTMDKDLVDRLGQFVGERFAEIGGQVHFHEVRGFGNHLKVIFQGDSEDCILLLGHLDTVWPAGEIRNRPFVIEGSRAWGPGVFDMKAGIFLMWMSIRTLKEARGTLPRSVIVLLNSDEEAGSNSSRSLIETEAKQSSAVLVLEPSLPGGTLKTSRKGVGRFTVKAIGRAAHAGIDPMKGINAVEEIAHQVLRLQRMTNREQGTTVTVGVVRGGTRTNVVPAEAVADVDVRIASLEEAERISKAIRALSPVMPGARLEVQGSIDRPPMERTEETVRLFQMARALAAELGIDLKEGSTGGGSDGNLTSALGIPTLDGLGAVGNGAHAVDEHILVDHLPWRAALLAGLIERIT